MHSAWQVELAFDANPFVFRLLCVPSVDSYSTANIHVACEALLACGSDVFFVALQIGIKDIKSELDRHLREQRKRLGCSDAEYWHSAKEKYQIQVPERYFSKSRQVHLVSIRARGVDHFSCLPG